MLVEITHKEIIFTTERGSSEAVIVYQLPQDDKIHKKVKSYKTVRGLRAYCEKNLTLVSHYDPLIEPVSQIPPTVNTDNKIADGVGVVDSEGEALLFDDYDDQILEVCTACGVEASLTSEGFCAECYQLSQQPIIRTFKTHPKRKTDDPENYRHEVDYTPIYDDDDYLLLGCN